MAKDRRIITLATVKINYFVKRIQEFKNCIHRNYVQLDFGTKYMEFCTKFYPVLVFSGRGENVKKLYFVKHHQE